jgi:hypothetical protein
LAGAPKEADVWRIWELGISVAGLPKSGSLVETSLLRKAFGSSDDSRCFSSAGWSSGAFLGSKLPGLEGGLLCTLQVVWKWMVFAWGSGPRAAGRGGRKNSFGFSKLPVQEAK